MQRRARPNRARSGCFKKVEGFVGGRRRLLRTAKETCSARGMFAFRDRRARSGASAASSSPALSAAAEMADLKYSRLIHGLRLANIGLDRKSLSEVAIFDPETFDAIIAKCVSNSTATIRLSRHGKRRSRREFEELRSEREH